MKLFDVNLPNIDGSNYWECVEASDAASAALKYVREDSPDRADLVIFVREGDERTGPIQVFYLDKNGVVSAYN